MRRLIKSRAAFTIIELMIGSTVFLGLIATAGVIFSKLHQKGIDANERASLQVVSEIAANTMKTDVDLGVFFEGNTPVGTHYNDTKTYGLMRFPFQAEGDDVNDGLQIYAIDSVNSLQDSFKVTTLVVDVGQSTITVEGDFRPLTNLSEDLFVMKVGSYTELFKLTGNISVQGVDTLTSTFVVAEEATDFIDFVDSPDVAGYPEIYRVSKIVYRIGDGIAETEGLYRSARGVTRLIQADVATMQIRYRLQSRDGLADTDCASKSDARYFVHDQSDADCDWNDVQTLVVEMVLHGDNGGAESTNPHSGEVSSQIKYLKTMSLSPLDYSAHVAVN